MSDQVDRRLLLGAAGLAGVAALSRLSHAGPLNPPAGPVGATGRTTAELWDKVARTDAGIAEPRTPISAATTPGDANSTFRITASGSYYLTGNITGAAGRAMIAVAAEFVSIDLNGFTMNGANAATAGITTTAGAFGPVIVRNGLIRNIAGPACSLQHNSLVEHVQVEGCDIGLVGGDGFQVRNCGLQGCGGPVDATGIEGGDGALVESCVFHLFSAVTTGAAIRVGNSARIAGCALYLSAGASPIGIQTGFSCTVEGNTLRIASLVAGFIGVQCAGGAVRGNTLSAPTGSTMTGIRATGSVTVAENVVNNFTTGIDLGTSTGCVVVRNSVRNTPTAIASTAPSSNVLGPAVTPATVAANSNPHANYIF